jgi:hypothetical protein
LIPSRSTDARTLSSTQPHCPSFKELLQPEEREVSGAEVEARFFRDDEAVVKQRKGREL